MMYYISDFCHLCLKDEKCLIDLSQGLPENNSIAAKLKICISEVNWSTYKRLLICKLCHQKLELAYDFKQSSLNSVAMLKNRLTLLKGNGKSKAPILKARLHVPLFRETVSKKLTNAYLKIQSKTGKHETLSQILDNKPMVYAPTASFILTNGQQVSYQNIFLNFVSTDNTVYPGVTSSSPVLLNIANQNMSESNNDAILKQLLETKQPEELSVEIDPDLYDFEHFLVSSKPIPTPNIECRECGKAYTTIKLLRQHFDDVHGGILPYMCTFCFSKFLLKDHYDKHMKHHIEISDTLAGSTVNLDNLSRVPQSRILGNKIQNEYKCTECSTVCVTVESFEKHLADIHDINQAKVYYIRGEKNATCPICEKDFSTSSYLDQHMKLHKDTTGILNKQINKKNKIRKQSSKNNPDVQNVVGEPQSHRTNIDIVNGATVTDEKTQEGFKNDSVQKNEVEIKAKNLRSESGKVENNNLETDAENPGDMQFSDSAFNEYIIESPDGKPVCSFCKKPFGRKHDLRRHINNVHIKSMQYQCHLCGDKFYEGGRLTRHLRSHYNSLSCTECHRVFTTLREVTNHMISSHMELKDIGCNVCFVTFKTIEEVKQHMKQHLLEVVYKCHICKQQFSECRDLTKHVSEHNGMKPCDNCNRMFYEEDEFVLHKETCTTGRYKCDVCPKAFKKKRYLQTHIKARHSVEICIDAPPKKRSKIDDDT